MDNPARLPPSAASVTFWGATHSVTGSMHLVEAAGQKILLDCGSVRGPRSHPQAHNVQFPFDPRTIDAVVLSHAHTDHCGNLPNLVRLGFGGPIFCTGATRDLTRLMLGNSSRIQADETHVFRVLGRPADLAAADANFAAGDVERTHARCVAVPYNEPREIVPGVWLRLSNAGHLLGSATVSLTFEPAGAALTFTGDLGRRGAPLLCGADPLASADLLISESTYGGRTVESFTTSVESLLIVARRTLERGGKVLIPAFSLGRTQVVAHVLLRGLQEGRLPAVPVFVDSPLAADIADVYRHYPDELDEATAGRLRQGINVLGEGALHYVRTQDESKELDERREPCVILAPSGMCEGGRILRHIKNHIDDPRCSIVLVNYQAPHTPGRRLLERGPTIRIHGKKLNKWAEEGLLPGFSGHADHADLLAALTPLAGRARVRLVHGEPEEAQMLARALLLHGFAEVHIPMRGEKAVVLAERKP